MIINTKHNNAVVSGNMKSHDFGIGDPVLVLDILRNRLYKNPIRIVVQEYIANARDAHLEAELFDTPIKVQAPTELKPEFSVEDFGASMTEEQIATIFTQYGVSTKRESDEFTGGFGIGSKSGWSYTDSYSVVTRTEENGKIIERMYCAFIDDSGLGKINLMSTKEVEGKTGTKIIVPVERSDSRRFRSEIIELWKYFTFPLEVVGMQSYEMDKDERPEVIKRGDVSHYKDNGGYYYTTKVIVDGIAYGYELDDMVKANPEAKADLEFLRKYKLIPVFTVRDIEVSPDRSSIPTSKKNADSISKWVEAFCEDIRVEVEEITKEMTTIREYVNTYFNGGMSDMQKDVLAGTISTKFDVDVAKVKDIYDEINIVKGKLFSEDTHYVAWQIDESKFKDDENVVLIEKSKRRGWSGSSTTVARIKEELSKIVTITPIPKAKRGRTKAFYKYPTWGRPVKVETLDELENFKYYVVRNTKEGTFDLGDGRGMQHLNPRNEIHGRDKVVFCAKGNVETAEEYGLRPYHDYLRKTRLEVLKHHRTSPGVYETFTYEDIDYDWRQYRDIIPEIGAYMDAKQDKDRKQNHDKLGLMFTTRMLSRDKFVERTIGGSLKELENKYPMLLASRYGDDWKKLAKEYVDNQNKSV